MYSELKEFGKVKLNELMSKHTTFRIGGPVDFFVTVTETEKLIGLLKYLDGEGASYFILGGGSNMLVSDEGYRGVAIKCQMSNVKCQNDALIAEAGCSIAAVSQESIKAGLAGFEWAVGVPGTIGGAVRGNAGAMAGEMKDQVDSVEVYRDGEVIILSNAECQFGYRDSVFKHSSDVILRVTLKLEKGDSKELMKKALDCLKYRSATQPPGFSSGCIFKNFQFSTCLPVGRVSNLQCAVNLPEEFIKKGKIPAGWLVEQVGMKGAQVGQAQVSEKHGNFIVNLGGATAQDVLALIEQIKEKVYTKFGISIEEEIQVV